MWKRKTKDPGILVSPQNGAVMDDPVAEFAEVYGRALLGQQRIFVIAALMGVVAAFAVIALWRVSSTKVAVPFMYQVADGAGVISRPVRLEPGKPNQNVLKAELAKWLEQVYTIDSKQTLQFFREANARSSGKAIEQFRDFRVNEDIMRRLKDQPDFIRTATVNSVDVSQDGLAYGYLTTRESGGNEAPKDPKTYRVTLHYKIVPPTTEAGIYQNPLGLYVTFFNPIQERR